MSPLSVVGVVDHDDKTSEFFRHIAHDDSGTKLKLAYFECSKLAYLKVHTSEGTPSRMTISINESPSIAGLLLRTSAYTGRELEKKS